MVCPNCGAKLNESDIFCDQCGYSFARKKTGTGKRKPYVLLVIIMLVMTVVAIGGTAIWFVLDDYHSPEDIKAEYQAASESLSEDWESVPEDIDGQEEVEEFSVAETQQEETENKAEELQDAQAEYILSDSDKKYLTDSDVEGLSLRELNYARNEIYARHGRMFKSDELQSYFDSKSWYTARYEAGDFDDNYSGNMLNAYEKKNAEFLREKELSVDPAGYQLDAG